MKQLTQGLSAMSNLIFPPRAVSSQRSYIRVLFLIALTLVIYSINTQQTNAVTFIVTTNADPDNTTGSCAANGTCSLRQAVNAANAAACDDTIDFAAGLANQIITLMQALNDIDITSNVVIDATGVSGIQVSGANAIRVFFITGATVTLRGFTIRDGNSTGSNNVFSSGGGILTRNTLLTLDNMIITANFGDGSGGGGILADSGGSLTITNSTISNNMGNNSGGGIHLISIPTVNIANSIITNNTAANAEGGGIISSGNSAITVTNVQITNNHADNNPSGSGGGIAVSGGSLIAMNNSTLSGNTSFTRGGGVYILGGATHRISGTTFSGNTSNGNGGGVVTGSGATVNMVNSTLSGNSALNGGGIYNDFNANSVTTTLRNVTVAGNIATTGQGGGIFRNGGTITLANTIVSDSVNNANAPIADLAGTINSLGNNLFENVGTANINGTTTGNQTGVDPMLGALQNNGGTTQTRALLTGSSAIDAGSNAQALGTDNTTPLTGDQRGFMRIVDGDGNSTAIVDIGAYEFNAAPTAASITIGGRVILSKGRGIGSARVTLTGANGETRIVMTNSFGFYRFAEVAAGETYIIQVRHKRYWFAAQVLNVTEDLDDLNFYAEL